MNNVDKVKQPLVDVKNEVILGSQAPQTEDEADVFLPDVSIITKAAEFVSENLPAN